MSATTAPAAPRLDGTKERSRLIKLIHVGRREIGMADDAWRSYLESTFKVQSSTQLHVGHLEQALAHLKRKGFKPAARAAAARPAEERPGGEWDFIWRAAEEKRPLLRKIFALCRELGGGRTYAEGVAKRQCGSERRLEMMSYDELYKVAQALATTQRGRAAKAQAQAEQGVTV